MAAPIKRGALLTEACVPHSIYPRPSRQWPDWSSLLICTANNVCETVQDVNWTRRTNLSLWSRELRLTDGFLHFHTANKHWADWCNLLTVELMCRLFTRRWRGMVPLYDDRCRSRPTRLPPWSVPAWQYSCLTRMHWMNDTYYEAQLWQQLILLVSSLVGLH